MKMDSRIGWIAGWWIWIRVFGLETGLGHNWIIMVFGLDMDIIGL